MKRTRVSLLAGALIFVACTHAAGVTLRYRFKPGQVLKYKQMVTGAGMMTASGESETPRSTYQGEVTVKSVVLSVAAGGTARIREELVGGQWKETENGDEHTGRIPPEKSLVTMTPTGRVTREKKAGAASPQQGDDLVGDILRGLEFTKKDVKVGETWSAQLRIRLEDVGDVPVSVTQKLSAIRKFKGRDCAVVDVTFEAPFSHEKHEAGASGEIAGKLAGSGTIFFDFKQGVELQSTLSLAQQVRVTVQVGSEAHEVKQTMKMNLKQYLLQ